MKYLVTGGAGFIGSHLVAHLVATGNEVVVLDNFSTGQHSNIEGLPVTLIEGDIRDISSVAQAVQEVDTVFHHAAVCSVAHSMADPVNTHDVNASGTLNVLEASRRAGVRRVVLASSSAIYGDSEALPKTEDMQPEPLSPYAVSKLIGEYYCRLYSETFSLETVALRYFNVFGPRQSPDSDYAAVIPKFIQMILDGERPHIYGDGSQTRDFTFVQDVVMANMAAAASAEASGQVINVACGSRYSLLDLLESLEQTLSCRVPPVFREKRPGDVLHSQASIEKAGRLLGFAPGVGFEEGLKATTEWFLATQQAEPRMLPMHERGASAGQGARAFG